MILTLVRYNLHRRSQKVTSFSISTLLLITAVLISPAHGQNGVNPANSSEVAPPPNFELPNLWQTGLQMLLWLLIMVALIFVSVWLMKKLMNPRNQGSGQKPINSLFQETIGPGKSICLVRVLDQIHVIGVTNTQISYLSTLEEHEMDTFNQWLGDDALLDQRLKSGFQSFLSHLSRKSHR